jgi:sterol desaturase/sphingolipid hydroxylase (fatty acid hydroxylase superfamily)
MGHVIAAVAFIVTGLLFSLWEHSNPARKVVYRTTIWRDLGSAICGLVFDILAEILLPYTWVDDWRFSMFLGQWLDTTVPLWLRFVIFFLLSDLLYYGFHRLMHGPLWSTHKWHHYPRQLWWLSGMRASFPHVLFVGFPFFLFWLMNLPLGFILVYQIVLACLNNWMHVNVAAPWMRSLEWVVVTPRYHAIHHSISLAHRNKNLGGIFSFWDRLFGTYLDPSLSQHEALEFGINEEVSTLRLMIGL